MRSHHKQTPTAKHTWEAHSTYAASLGVPDRRRYRRTPPGSPTVGDLVRPGDTVSTFYSTGGFVIEVKEHFYAAEWRNAIAFHHRLCPARSRGELPRYRSSLDQRLCHRRRPYPDAVRGEFRRGIRR
jgi:hypothetical protein